MLRYRPETREIMYFRFLGISNNEILIFLYQNEATKIQLRLLQYNLNTFPLKKGQQIVINMSYTF